ncbi:MAG: ABC transporter substrate-binding protein [Anaerolineae bacterium]|nr:ABC transporter substrate-binding protein [Anaerolineae bacterium]
MTQKTILRGITWNHSRGYISVMATAQRFSEMNPHVDIQWDKRSLQEFADAPIQALAEKYDLLVIDHPWAGFAAFSDVLLPLQDHIPSEYLKDQASNSVGHSHFSYVFDGNQCALAIDAATPVAAYRPDLLQHYGLEQPQTWQDLLALAGQGRVIMPAIPIDTLMNFYMLCATQGQAPFVEDEWVVSDDLSLKALEQLRELTSLCPKEVFNWNPIAVYEALSRRDDFVYCPFAYGYSNYSRHGYSDNILIFGNCSGVL